MSRVLLISLRDPKDPMAAHERLCFAEACELDIDQVATHSMTEGVPARWRLKEVDALLFGGSGAFSVLDDVVWIRQGLDLLVDVVMVRLLLSQPSLHEPSAERAMAARCVRVPPDASPRAPGTKSARRRGSRLVPLIVTESWGGPCGGSCH